ncbi:inositol oxygenase [Cryptococcus deuterogattii 99/473]|uniref:Inositol oxygenase n=2 Tax=Cryptococcus deuterogattii TaxID=1859096 RepID=A0A0D0UYS8_9TREE|nr:inositol oxygenase [Cryptococcus deuterogattii R265]KIR37860.1 inositol oxygenase [Cryptococcus deuterogattii Ram5]KIR70137.1 inositol oxygenase [Cryptococcus deuterogattii CA1014]KIY56740.1 inositol oxygenase [Cryptococcus deuterogattii 99/473]
MHAPEINDYIKHEAAKLDKVSDEIDEVNILKLKQKNAVEKTQAEIEYDLASKFDQEKDKAAFRQYEDACDRVKNFYAEQHLKQTYEYNVKIRQEFRNTVRARMSVWEAMELLDNLVDESDPDTSVGQIEHLLQTAEAIRRDGKPEWMQVTGLIHDLGKLLCFFGADGQWDVVGDTFVVGCQFSDKIIYPDTFKANPDYNNAKLNTKYGVYEPNCGLDNVLLSWGHDEYMYEICKNQSTLPQEALAMIRYHSFYPWHREGAYQHLMNEKDYDQLKAVKAFNPYDLYSKSDDPPKKAELKPYYQGLISKFFPDEVQW